MKQKSLEQHLFHVVRSTPLYRRLLTSAGYHHPHTFRCLSTMENLAGLGLELSQDFTNYLNEKPKWTLITRRQICCKIILLMCYCLLGSQSFLLNAFRLPNDHYVQKTDELKGSDIREFKLDLNPIEEVWLISEV